MFLQIMARVQPSVPCRAVCGDGALGVLLCNDVNGKADSAMVVSTLGGCHSAPFPV
jgi:hypothetical protein